MAPTHPRAKPRNTKSKRSFSNNVPPGLHYLLPPDPKSEKFLELFRSFLSSQDERRTILALSEEDAKLFIEIVDRALRVAKLEIELRKIAFSVLRRLCGRIGHLPESYQLSDKFDLSGMPHASGGFADVRMGVYKGKDVAVKSLRVAELDDKLRIRKRFCKEVAMWKNLSHPNVLNLIGVPDTLQDGRFSMVSDWMANGNIMAYVRANSGNHLKLLADAIEGLSYLHNADIVHGDLKGANILITNTNPVSACLADFGFMTIVHDPSLGMESSASDAGGGTTPFMAPELLVPSKFGLGKCIPTKEADIYAMAMVIYQVLTGTIPFGKQTGPEVVIKVLSGTRPSKPTNALSLGFSDDVWKLLEDSWPTDRGRRPPVKEVLARIKSAASACRILSPVGGVVQRYEEPDSDFTKFDQLFLGMATDVEEIGSYHGHIPLSRPSSIFMNSPPAMERPPSQESDTSMPDSLFSKLSEAETFVTEPAGTSTDALALGVQSKSESTEDLPAFLFDLASHRTYHPQPPTDPISRSTTPGLEGTSRPRIPRENSGPYRNHLFAESNGSSRTLLFGIATQRNQPRYDTDAASITSTAVSHDREPHCEKRSIPDATATPFPVVSDVARQKSKPPSTPPSYSPKSRLTEPDASPQFDEHKNRQSRFRIRQRLSRVFDPILHQADTHKQPS